MQTVIPAQPGFNVVLPISDFKDDIEFVAEVYFEPVIGWLIETDGQGRADTLGPITPIWGLRDEGILKDPNGKYTDACQDYKNMCEVIREFNLRLERDRKRRQMPIKK